MTPSDPTNDRQLSEQLSDASPVAPDAANCTANPAAQQPAADAPPDGTQPDRGGQRVSDRAATPEVRAGAPSPRRAGPSDFDVKVQQVRLDEIDGVDEEIEQFLREHDVLTEVSVQADRWSSDMIRCAIQALHLPLWSRRGRLVLLGSGRALTLASRLARYGEKLPATVIQAKTLSLQQKLTFVAHELLFLPALHRTAPGYPAAAVALCQALDQTGVATLKRSEPRQFALATGMSLPTLKPHWQAGNAP